MNVVDIANVQVVGRATAVSVDKARGVVCLSPLHDSCRVKASHVITFIESSLGGSTSGDETAPQMGAVRERQGIPKWQTRSPNAPIE